MSPYYERQLQAKIRGRWPEFMLEFRVDGQLWYKPRTLGSSWGVLLTQPQLQGLFLSYRSET